MNSIPTRVINLKYLVLAVLLALAIVYFLPLIAEAQMTCQSTTNPVSCSFTAKGNCSGDWPISSTVSQDLAQQASDYCEGGSWNIESGPTAQTVGSKSGLGPCNVTYVMHVTCSNQVCGPGGGLGCPQKPVGTICTTSDGQTGTCTAETIDSASGLITCQCQRSSVDLPLAFPGRLETPVVEEGEAWWQFWNWPKRFLGLFKKGKKIVMNLKLAEVSKEASKSLTKASKDLTASLNALAEAQKNLEQVKADSTVINVEDAQNDVAAATNNVAAATNVAVDHIDTAIETFAAIGVAAGPSCGEACANYNNKQTAKTLENLYKNRDELVELAKELNQGDTKAAIEAGKKVKKDLAKSTRDIEKILDKDKKNTKAVEKKAADLAKNLSENLAKVAEKSDDVKAAPTKKNIDDLAKALDGTDKQRKKLEELRQASGYMSDEFNDIIRNAKPVTDAKSTVDKLSELDKLAQVQATQTDNAKGFLDAIGGLASDASLRSKNYAEDIRADAEAAKDDSDELVVVVLKPIDGADAAREEAKTEELRQALQELEVAVTAAEAAAEAAEAAVVAEAEAEAAAEAAEEAAEEMPEVVNVELRSVEPSDEKPALALSVAIPLSVGNTAGLLTGKVPATIVANTSSNNVVIKISARLTSPDGNIVLRAESSEEVAAGTQRGTFLNLTEEILARLAEIVKRLLGGRLTLTITSITPQVPADNVGFLPPPPK